MASQHPPCVSLLLALSVAVTLSVGRGQEVTVSEGMVLIPGGTAVIGIDEEELSELARMGRKVPHMSERHARGWFGDETPRHEVELEPFVMDVHEVTNAQFRCFVDATGYWAQGDWLEAACEERDEHPVVNVTWHDASAYAEWAGKRLPTEAEWEHAARGGAKVRWFPWGDEPDPERANWRHQGESFLAGLGRTLFGRRMGTRPVGSYPANGYGLHDMVGNVAEWCSSTYGPYPGLDIEDCALAEDGEDSPRRTQRMVRGGSWDSPNPVFVRINRRSHFDPGYGSRQLGFRCVRSVAEERGPEGE